MMATAQVVITESCKDTPEVGSLFERLSFFLVQRLPSRSSFVEKIQSNGGRVVRLENQADYTIADHFRKDCPAGSISYTFIDAAIRDGELPDVDEHKAGRSPGTVREAGSAIPGKSTRTPFTAEDDRVLWQWVERHREAGGLVKGNEIYKQLEAINPRHTYQAWRDRYIKKLMDRPPAGVEVKVVANAPPSPPTVQDEQQAIPVDEPGTQPLNASSPKKRRKQQVAKAEFEPEDVELLIDQGSDIEDIDASQLHDAWLAWAGTIPHRHSAQSWRELWEEKARPAYLQMTQAEREERKQRRAADKKLYAVDDENGSENGVNSTEERQDELRDAALGRPASSGSQKRKRETPTRQAKQTYGRKKLKPESVDLFAQDDSDENRADDSRGPRRRSPRKPSTQPIEIPADDDEPSPPEQHGPTSELNQAAKTQLEQEDQGKERQVLSFELRDAQLQAQSEFDEEVLGIPRSNGESHAASMSNMPTSDINRAADQQLRRESVERQDHMVIEDEDSLPETPRLQSSQVNVLSQGQLNGGASVNMFNPNGNALTEANLASQQAQHRAQLLRGSDLPEDDEEADGDMQDQYVKFLQTVTKQPSGSQEPVVEIDQQQKKGRADAFESGLASNGLQFAHRELEAEDIAELPISSQHEIDGAIDDIIQWPESPKMSPRRDLLQSPSQSFGLETQVSYPNLPAEHPEITGQQDELTLSSQASVPQVPYPLLSRQQQEPAAPQQAQYDEDVVFSQPPASSQQGSVEETSSYVLVQNEAQSSSSPSEEAGDELDLSMPPPDGGWEMSSSPAKVFDSSPARPMQSQLRDLTKQDFQPTDEQESDVEIVEEVHEVVELTSSSSSSSSDDDSEASAAADVVVEERKKALETQDIVNAETQQPDLGMPLPPDSDDESDDLYSDSVNQPSSPPNAATLESQHALAETQKLPDNELDAYIDKMVVFGYKEASVIAALKCTSMRPDLAELVLLDEKAGKGLPKDVAGIWSEGEDQMLESGNARGLRKLEERHTWKECEERMQFLQEWRDEE